MNSYKPISEQWWSAEAEPLVTVLCPAFNQAPYIEETIEGFLRQETDFPVRIQIRDDHSTDGTTEILRKYEQRYPRLFDNIYEAENQFSRGIRALPTMIPRARSPYLAFCDGDDKWLDTRKLQVQVSFLENNPDYALCYHNYYTLKGGESVLHAEPSYPLHTFEDYAMQVTGIQTLTVVGRNVFGGLDIPQSVISKLRGSYFWFLIMAEHGRIHYIAEPMAAYRVHGQGIWSGASRLGQGQMSVSNKAAMVEYYKDNRKAYKLLKRTYVGGALQFFYASLKALSFRDALVFLQLSVRYGLTLLHLIYPFRSVARKLLKARK